jgi:hypothetical protein
MKTHSDQSRRALQSVLAWRERRSLAKLRRLQSPTLISEPFLSKPLGHSALMKSKKNLPFAALLLFMFPLAGLTQAFAASAILTAATGGGAISADTAAGTTWTSRGTTIPRYFSSQFCSDSACARVLCRS